MTPTLRLLLSRAYLLIDTCTLIDANNVSLVRDFLEECVAESCTLLSIDPVFLELSKGADTLQHRREKKALYDTFAQETLPMTAEIFENAQKLSVVYQKQGKDLSITDFLLGATLMKYQTSSTFLMTSNVSDFPTDIFDLMEILTLQKTRNAFVSFGFYKFSDQKYQEKLVNLLSMDKKQAHIQTK